jgi:hypothetical protein
VTDTEPQATDAKSPPASDSLGPTPGNWILTLGVIYPAAVIAFELATHFCADTFFDPLPTFWHAVAAASVPASNLLVWYRLRNSEMRHAKWLAFVNGAAIAIATLYALLFLPLLPVALVGIFFAIGVLPIAPMVSLWCALLLRRALARRQEKPSSTWPLVAGLSAGLVVLVALDVPATATRLGVQWAASDEPSWRERGLSLLRSFGDDDLLLRLCYSNAGRPSGLLSAIVIFGDTLFAPETPVVSQAQAREIYYRVSGVPFNIKPPPVQNRGRSLLAGFQFDDDLGGTQVGGRLRGLHLVSSRMDGSISGDDAVAYLEWTVEFRNSEPVEREVRMQVALPPGGVVSRATLWVNGEEREAAYGGRNEVRAAYQRVAVQQRRDPLLVTTKGADRVLAQAFPVPRNGGTIKFKLGITAPLDIASPSKAHLTLPAIVDRNFSFAADSSHKIWIESKQGLEASAPSLTASRIDPRLFRIEGAITDRDLARTRQMISVDRDNAVSRVVARLGENEPIVQQIVRGSAPATDTLMLVIDGSARIANVGTRLVQALAAIPDGFPVGAILASAPLRSVAPAPWSADQHAQISALLRQASFFGGQDNAPALAAALLMLETKPNAALVWIHGPQPVNFREGAARLEQATSRLKQLPQLLLYSVEPGPNELLPDAPWAWSARSLPQTGTIDTDLSDLFTRLSNRTGTVIERTQDQPAGGLTQGSDHIARLWANHRTLELLRTNPNANRAAAAALATRYQLVTPVTGAVVLETKQQYDESRLTPASPASVPTVPEPHEWMLILIVCAFLGWLVLRNRQRFAVTA